MEQYYGRRGKETGVVSGLNRAHQTMLLMVAMVATMAVVLLWEASPLVISGVAQSSVPEAPVSALEELATLYESSRPVLRNYPPAAKTNEGSADLPESDVTPIAREESEPEMIAETSRSVVDDAPPEAKPKSFATTNSTMAEPEKTSLLAEEETTFTERRSVGKNSTSESTLTAEERSEVSLEAEETRPDGVLILDADHDAKPTLRAPLAGSKAMNSTSGVKDEGEAITTETTDSGVYREEPVCDYAVGKWVLDETRPLYSGLECKMWLSPGFSCRLNKHPDKRLDRYRWQPAGCNLPVFNASAVLEMLRNKVVAFVGDSLGRQQLQSLLCMLTRGKNDTAVTDVGSSFGFYTPRGERKPNGFAFRFDATNTTIMYKWSVTLARIQPLNGKDPTSRNALHLDRPEAFIETHLPVVDVLMLNSGHHWNGGKMKQNRFDFYLQGKPVEKSQPVSRVPVAYNATVHNVVHWIHNATKTTPEKIVYYRSLSPRHFRNGDWNTGGTCDTITFGKDNQVQEGMRVDANAESAVIGTTVNLLNITSLSLERGETHVSKYGGGQGGQDCLHWCLPGIPDTWNEIFFAELARKWNRTGVASTRSE